MISGRVLDPTAILDIATGRSQYGQATVAYALTTGMVLAVPAAALMEAWAGSPTSGYPFLAALRELPVVVLESLDADAAEHVGLLAAERGRPASGVAHAVYVARRRGWPILTGDTDAVLSLDPAVGFESFP